MYDVEKKMEQLEQMELVVRPTCCNVESGSGSTGVLSYRRSNKRFAQRLRRQSARGKKEPPLCVESGPIQDRAPQYPIDEFSGLVLKWGDGYELVADESCNFGRRCCGTSVGRIVRATAQRFSLSLL